MGAGGEGGAARVRAAAAAHHAVVRPAPEIAAQRLAGARVPDKFEAQPVEFFRRVAQGYAARAAADAKRFVRIEASQARDQVWQQVETALVARGVLSPLGGASR